MDRNNTPLTVEQFAAYLDGNLPATEAEAVEQVMATNPDMAELMDAAIAIDQTIFEQAPTLELPDELYTMPLPTFDHEQPLTADEQPADDTLTVIEETDDTDENPKTDEDSEGSEHSEDSGYAEHSENAEIPDDSENQEFTDSPDYPTLADTPDSPYTPEDAYGDFTTDIP